MSVASAGIRRPKPGRFGFSPAILSSGICGALTANATTKLGIGASPKRACITAVAAVCSTVAADADGTTLATLKKYDASADAAVTLSSALDLEAMTANEASAFTITTTLTDAQRMLDTGDFLYVDVVNNSLAIDTQPVNLIFTAEISIVE